METRVGAGGLLGGMGGYGPMLIEGARSLTHEAFVASANKTVSAELAGTRSLAGGRLGLS